MPEFITNNQNLMKIINDIQDAKIEDGGGGAFYIYLKRKKLFGIKEKSVNLDMKWFYLNFWIKW